MENKKKASPLLIAGLVLLCLCFFVVCFWLGMKFYDKENSEEEPSENLTGEKIDFPQATDVSAVIGEFYEILTEDKLKTDFKNLEKKVNENTLVFNCEEFDENETSCAKVKLTINNEFEYEEEVPYALGTYNKIVFYKVNNYYIVYIKVEEGGCDANKLYIYKNNTQIYKSTLPIKSYYKLSDDINENIIYLKPAVVNNVLHFVEQADANSSGNNDSLKYNTIDLSKSEIEVNLVKQFNGYFGTCNR